MSRENVEIIRSIYEATNRRDWDAAFRDQHPDIEQILPSPFGPFRGREEVQAYWEDILAAFETAVLEPEEVFESGDQVVALLRIRARPKGTSAEIEIRTGQLWTFRDGKTASMQLFPDAEEALKAAGLRD